MNLYFIFAAHEPTFISSKCRFITSEEETLRSNIYFVKRIHSNPSDNNYLPIFLQYQPVDLCKVKFTVRKEIFLILYDKKLLLKGTKRLY
jgi:hypothetical protein